MTRAPTLDHESIAARLNDALSPYVRTHRLGLVYRPRAVLRFEGSEVEPDLLVRQSPVRRDETWDEAPIPVLVAEILSPYTRRRDHVQKRSLYMDAGVKEYWLVDPERSTITIVTRGQPDRVATGELAWSPKHAVPPLRIELAPLFG